jgi:AraC-like DNA-binding protein
VVSASSTGGAVDAKGILRLSFLELTPGQYVLEVGASMRPDKWDGKVCRVSFVVLAPWWRTTTAYWCYGIAAALLLAGGIALYLHLMRLKMQRKHKDEILLMRMRALFDQQLHAEDACNMVLAPQHEDTDPDTTEQRATPDRTEMEFINKATALVEQNLDNPKYSVEQLSRELCMERTGLYKKLTALLDKSPTLFIRNIRLKKAAELLETGTMNVQEISEKVGFCSPSYMGKCFQEEYGCKPSEYIRKHHSADNAQKAKG